MVIRNKLVVVVYRYTSRWAYNWGGGGRAYKRQFTVTDFSVKKQIQVTVLRHLCNIRFTELKARTHLLGLLLVLRSQDKHKQTTWGHFSAQQKQGYYTMD